MTAILVIDDDPTFGSEIDTAFRKRDLQVHIANSFGAASALIESFDYAAIILDLLLHDGHGLTMLDTLRRDARAPSVVVVSKHIPDYARALLNYYPEVKVVFSKPVNVESLAETMLAIANSRERAKSSELPSDAG